MNRPRCVVANDLSSMFPENKSPGLTAEFGQHLTGCQSALYAFITTLLGGVEGASDVLQETNLALWKKAAEYDSSQPFLRWAYTFARFQAMAWRQKQARSRLVLDDRLVEQIAEEITACDSGQERELEALHHCLSKLPQSQRELVAERYFRAESVNDIAARRERPENAVAAMLYRIRRVLSDCIRITLTQEAQG